MNRLNITNISLTIFPLAKLFKNSYSMDFKQAIVDMVVVEDVFKKKKNKILLLTNLQICGIIGI